MKENPTIINNILNTIKVNNNKDGLLYIIKKVMEGIIIKLKDEIEVIINSGVDSNKRFDIKGEFGFDNQVNSNMNSEDENM